jgi:phage tail-like protein
LFQTSQTDGLGDFAPEDRTSAALRQPNGIAVDGAARLFVAEFGAARVLIFDLVDRRLLRIARLDPPARPLDLATDGNRVHVLQDAPPYLVTLDAWRGPEPAEAGRADLGMFGSPSRLAILPGQPDDLWVLFDAGAETAKIVGLARTDDPIEIPGATDLEFAPSGANDGAWLLVVARGPEAEFERYRIAGQSIVRTSNLRARGYDGRGIVRTPDGRVGYWSSRGFQHAAAARSRFVARGRVTTFRLDSGQYQTHWGRLFLDACLPRNTDVRVHCIAADEVPDEPPLPRQPPAVESLSVPRPDLSPPMPPASWVCSPLAWQRLHRRRDREIPWTPHEDRFATYEAPVQAAAGRYLWVVLELQGDTQFTPRIKALRVEHSSHDLLRRLPRHYSREAAAADFLRRYLAIFEGALDQWNVHSTERLALVDAWSAPPEALPWLAAFVGLVLDRRWPEHTQRTAIAEAVDLFRRRGTVGGLKRFLEIYLGVEVKIVEKFRLRGLGGAELGLGYERLTNTVVGQFRVGGAVGETGDALPAAPDAFATHAHRFSVIIPASLDAEQTDVVRRILDVHRPAHTLYEICTVDAGLRMGRGAYLELTTVVGASGAFGRLQTGRSTLGVSDVLGRPGPGVRIGASRVGYNTRGG